jgi:lipopolysaccharide export system permease protein
MRVTPDETGMIMVLYNGSSATELEEKNVNADQKKYPFRRDFFEEQTIVVSLRGFELERSQFDLFKSHSAVLNISELTFYIDSMNTNFRNNVSVSYEEFIKIREDFISNFTRPRQVTDSSIHLSGNYYDTFDYFNSLSPENKELIVSRAIENIKSSTTFLTEKIESLHNEIKFIKRYEVDWNRKLTVSFACLVFFFIGAPLGAIIRKGGLGTPSVISILFFVIYYVINLSGEKLVKENLVSTFAGMWAASYILLPIGIFLTYKATTDSSIMNIETYLAFFTRIKDSIYRFVFNLKKENNNLEKQKENK